MEPQKLNNIEWFMKKLNSKITPKQLLIDIFKNLGSKDEIVNIIQNWKKGYKTVDEIYKILLSNNESWEALDKFITATKQKSKKEKDEKSRPQIVEQLRIARANAERRRKK